MRNRTLRIVENEEPEIGLRERGKQERLRRIKEAAYEAFRRDGYEGASTRAIARMAGVSIGTLFVYARDKRDLLFLVLNEDLDDTVDRTLATLPKTGSCVSRIIALLGPIYVYFGRDPALARVTVQESSALDLFVERGAQAERFYARMQRAQHEIKSILDEAAAAGKLTIGDDSALLARAIFTAHLGEVRRWLQNDKPDARDGINNLERLLKVIIGDRERL